MVKLFNSSTVKEKEYRKPSLGEQHPHNFRYYKVEGKHSVKYPISTSLSVSDLTIKANILWSIISRRNLGKTHRPLNCHADWTTPFFIQRKRAEMGRQGGERKLWKSVAGADCTHKWLHRSLLLLLDHKTLQNAIRICTVLHWPRLPRLLVSVCSCKVRAERSKWYFPYFQYQTSTLIMFKNFCVLNTLSSSKFTTKKTCYQFTAVSKAAADSKNNVYLSTTLLLQESCVGQSQESTWVHQMSVLQS